MIWLVPSCVDHKWLRAGRGKIRRSCCCCWTHWLLGRCWSHWTKRLATGAQTTGTFLLRLESPCCSFNSWSSSVTNNPKENDHHKKEAQSFFLSLFGGKKSSLHLSFSLTEYAFKFVVYLCISTSVCAKIIYRMV